MNINVILSGGVGSRLWPLSRRSMPKQYLPIFEGESLFEKTINRNLNLTDGIIVVGNIENTHLSKAIVERLGINPVSEIVESHSRNTAAAIAFAAFSMDIQDLLLVTPSDHVIEDVHEYERAVQDAFKLAAKGYLVTFGIIPTRPEIGYGYVQAEGNDVIDFHEKPYLEKAKEYVDLGDYFWNSGIFCFQAGVYLEELQKFRPDIFETCKAAYNKRKKDTIDKDLSAKIPPVSIDFAVMEKSNRIKMVKGSFEWSDLGSFESLFDYFKGKSSYVQGTNLIIAEDYVEVFGVEQMLIVQHKGALLIMPIAESQEVKNIYNKLNRNNSNLL